MKGAGEKEKVEERNQKDISVRLTLLILEKNERRLTRKITSLINILGFKPRYIVRRGKLLQDPRSDSQDMRSWCPANLIEITFFNLDKETTFILSFITLCSMLCHFLLLPLYICLNHY